MTTSQDREVAAIRLAIEEGLRPLNKHGRELLAALDATEARAQANALATAAAVRRADRADAALLALTTELDGYLDSLDEHITVDDFAAALHALRAIVTRKDQP